MHCLQCRPLLQQHRIVGCVGELSCWFVFCKRCQQQLLLAVCGGQLLPRHGGQHRHRLPRGRLLRRDGFVGGRQLFRWPVFVGDRHVDGQYMPAMSHRFVLPVCWHGERDPVSCWFLLQRHGSVGIVFVHGGFVRFHHWAHCVRDCRARFFREHVGRVASSGVRSRDIRVVDWSLDLQRVSRWQFCQCFWNVDQYALRCRQLRRHHGLVCLCTGTRW